MSDRSHYIPEYAWEYWYHCMGNTYGTWLPGDPRGFRTRDHREHIEGDYKNPPSLDQYQSYRRKSQRSLRYTVVKLNQEARRVACQRFAEYFNSRGVQIADCAIDAVHFHLLARFEPGLLSSADPGTPPEVPLGFKDPGTRRRENPRLMIRPVT